MALKVLSNNSPIFVGFLNWDLAKVLLRIILRLWVKEKVLIYQSAYRVVGLKSSFLHKFRV
jgi:hypothetical protein